MLLSFERPAFRLGSREDMPLMSAIRHRRGDSAGVHRLSTVLEDCTEATISRHR